MTPKALRKTLGFTVEQMAHQLGYSPSMISMVENEKRSPSTRLVKAYERLSNGQVTLSDFKTIQ